VRDPEQQRDEAVEPKAPATPLSKLQGAMGTILGTALATLMASQFASGASAEVVADVASKTSARTAVAAERRLVPVVGDHATRIDILEDARVRQEQVNRELRRETRRLRRQCMRRDGATPNPRVGLAEPAPAAEEALPLSPAARLVPQENM
jgi:hypothetical protein